MRETKAALSVMLFICTKERYYLASYQKKKAGFVFLLPPRKKHIMREQTTS
jgi:hypothetical protein